MQIILKLMLEGQRVNSVHSTEQFILLKQTSYPGKDTGQRELPWIFGCMKGED